MYCPVCKGYSFEEHVCTNCGLVLEDRPIARHASITSDNEVIKGGKFRSQYLKDLSPTKINLRECHEPNLRRILKRNTPYWDLKRSFTMRQEIKRICGLLGLNKNVEISCVYCLNKIETESKKRGTSLFKEGGTTLEKVAQSVVFLVVRYEELPVTLYDFENIGCDKKEIYKHFSRLKSALKLKFKPTSSIIFVNKIIRELGLKPREESLLAICATSFLIKLEMLEKVIENPLSFRNQIVKAAAVMYILMNDVYKVTQKKLWTVVGCNSHALRNRIREIKDLLFRVGKIRYENKNWRKFNKEYRGFIVNASKRIDRPRSFTNGLIDMKYKMVITKSRKGVVELEFILNDDEGKKRKRTDK